MHSWTAAVLVGLFGLAAPAAAAAQTPKPPATLDAAGIDDWMKRYLTPDGWVLLTADAVSVTLGRPEITVNEAGLLQAEIRREYYRPTRLGSMNSRSNRQSWVVDCGGRRFQVVSMSVFLNNNLQGESFRRQALDGEWVDVAPGTPNAHVVDRVCAAGPAKSN
jgi:hypothetical protein